jgi:pimeloyl-CoA synthetase
MTTGEARRSDSAAGVWSQAAQEMDERIQERLHTQDITARTFHALALHYPAEQKSAFNQQTGERHAGPPVAVY